MQETKAKLYTEVLVLNPAKCLNISLHVERLQQGVWQDDLWSHTKHVVICFLWVYSVVYSFHQAVYKYKSSRPERASLSMELPYISGNFQWLTVDSAAVLYLCFNFIKNPVLLFIYWFYSWFTRLLMYLFFVVLRY